jgi:surfeit locus 1 family protein
LKTKLILLLLAVLIELALLRLGFWQLNRAQEKQAQQQQASEVLKNRQAIDLQGFDPISRRIEWTQGELRFLPEPLLLLDNQRREQAVGVSVYQLAMSSDGQALLVDLGWLPVPGNRQLPKPRALQGVLSVQGLLMPPPSKGLAMGPALTEQADGTLLLTRFDNKALSASLAKPLPERVLRLDPDLPIGFSRDLAIQVNTLTPEKHRGYAMQWFGLAAAFAVLCFGFWRRRK